MAELIKRTKKDGKTAYLARVYCGRDKDHKPICKTKTLTPPPGMTGRKLDKELQRQADEFEQAVLRGTLQSDMLFDALLDKYFSEYAEPQLRERTVYDLSLIHISEPTRRTPISYAVFCLKNIRL